MCVKLAWHYGKDDEKTNRAATFNKNQRHLVTLVVLVILIYKKSFWSNHISVHCYYNTWRLYLRNWMWYASICTVSTVELLNCMRSAKRNWWNEVNESLTRHVTNTKSFHKAHKDSLLWQISVQIFLMLQL